MRTFSAGPADGPGSTSSVGRGDASSSPQAKRNARTRMDQGRSMAPSLRARAAMRKKRTSAAALTAAFLCACAAGGRTAPLEGPSPQSDDPVIGRPFRVELPRGGERTLRLEGVRGRITLVCVLGESAERVADACAGVRERWRDRVAMVGIWVGEPGDLTGLPFRAYVDPGGESLR